MNVTAGRFPACLHAVDKHTSPRLGLVYEVQAIGGKAVDKPHDRITEEEPTCVCTASASIEGLDGLQILRVFTLPCNCREAGHGHAQDGRGKKMRKGGGAAGAACTSNILEVRLIDGSGVDADEASPTSTRRTGWDSMSTAEVREAALPPAPKEREVDEAAGDRDCESKHVIRVARPLCSNVLCKRCRWCCRDDVRGQPPQPGVGSSLCSVDLEDFVQKIIANLEWSHKKAFLLKSDFGFGDSASSKHFGSPRNKDVAPN